MNIFSHITYIEISQVFVGVTIFVVTIYFLKLIVQIVLINDQIESLTQDREKEIKYEKGVEGMILAVFDSKKGAIVEKYSEKIDPLVRRKSYILDIIPFFRLK